MLKNWIANPNVQFEYGEPIYVTTQEVKSRKKGYLQTDFYRWAIIENKSAENIG